MTDVAITNTTATPAQAAGDGLEITVSHKEQTNNPRSPYFIQFLNSFDLFSDNNKTTSPGLTHKGNFAAKVKGIIFDQKKFNKINNERGIWNLALQKLLRINPKDYIKNRQIEIGFFQQVEDPANLLEAWDNKSFNQKDLKNFMQQMFLDNKHIGGHISDKYILQTFINSLKDDNKAIEFTANGQPDIQNLLQNMYTDYKGKHKKKLKPVLEGLIKDIPYLLDYASMYEGISINENEIKFNNESIIDIHFDKSHGEFSLNIKELKKEHSDKDGLTKDQFNKAMAVMAEEIYKRATVSGSAKVRVSVDSKPAILLEGVYRLLAKGAKITNIDEVIKKLKERIIGTNIFNENEDAMKENFSKLLDKLTTVSAENFYGNMNNRQKFNEKEQELMSYVISRTNGNFGDRNNNTPLGLNNQASSSTTNPMTTPPVGGGGAVGVSGTAVGGAAVGIGGSVAGKTPDHHAAVTLRGNTPDDTDTKVIVSGGNDSPRVKR